MGDGRIGDGWALDGPVKKKTDGRIKEGRLPDRRLTNERSG